MKEKPVKPLVVWGIVCLAFSIIINLLTYNTAPSTKLGALLPGLLVGLLGWGFIVLIVLAIVFAIINKKTNK